jgi:hypothetical protein
MRYDICVIAAALAASWAIGVAAAQQGSPTQQAITDPARLIPPAIPIKSWADAFSSRRKIWLPRKAIQSRQADLWSYRTQDRRHG